MEFVVRATLLVIGLCLAGTVFADTRAEINAALDYYSEVWNEGDLDAISGYYHPEFMLVTSEGAVTLKQRIADLETIAQAGKDRGELRYSNIKVRELEENHAIAYGQVSLQFKDGSALNSWFTTLYEKTPFGWKAVLTHN